MQVKQIRSASVTKVILESKSPNHILHVAFNNLVVAAEKRFDGKVVKCKPGRCVGRTLYLPASSELKGWSLGQVDLMRLEISPATVQRACEQAGRKAHITIRPATPIDDPFVWHLACVIRADLRLGSSGGLLLRDSIQDLLVHHLARPQPAITSSLHEVQRCTIAPARLRAVCDYIASHMHQEIRLAILASVAGLSVFHFTRAFKMVVGVSPYQYVVEQRLSAGCRLLEATNLPVGEIAMATGFATPQGFAASFRRKWGVNPSSYRRSVCASR